MHPFNKLHDKKKTGIYGQLWRSNQLHSTKIRGIFHEKYLETCPENATYISNTTAESIVESVNFYFESKSIAEITKSKFITFYANEPKNSPHKECFTMFVTYYFNKAQKIVTSFLGFLNLKGKTVAQIMDVIKNFFGKIYKVMQKYVYSVGWHKFNEWKENWVAKTNKVLFSV